MSEKLRSMRRTMAGRRRGRSAGGRIPVVTIYNSTADTDRCVRPPHTHAALRLVVCKHDIAIV